MFQKRVLHSLVITMTPSMVKFKRQHARFYMLKYPLSVHLLEKLMMTELCITLYKTVPGTNESLCDMRIYLHFGKLVYKFGLS